jgi:ABC-type uncharacterized transport system permease subunit
VVEENEGINWIVSKLFFIFGNQVLPIALMPDKLISFAKVTPFYLALAAPIEAAAGRLNWVSGLTWSVGYIVVLLGAAYWLLGLIKGRLVNNG